MKMALAAAILAVAAIAAEVLIALPAQASAKAGPAAPTKPLDTARDREPVERLNPDLVNLAPNTWVKIKPDRNPEGRSF